MEIIRVWEDVRPRRRQRLVCSYLGFAMVVIKLLSDILTVDVTVCSGAYICVRGQEQVVLVLCPYRVHSRVCFEVTGRQLQEFQSESSVGKRETALRNFAWLITSTI